MAEICHLENRHTSFFCCGRSNLDKISQTGTEWHVDCSDMVEIETRARIPIWQSFWHIQCHVITEPRRVLPPGEFNVLISPTVTCHIAGCCHLENSMTWSQSHVSHCRVLPPGEFWMWHCVSVWASGEEDCMKSVGSIRWIQKLQEASVWCPELLRCRCRTRCGDVHGTPEVHCLLHMQERLWQCVNLWHLMALFSQYSCLLRVVRLNNIILPCITV